MIPHSAVRGWIVPRNNFEHQHQCALFSWARLPATLKRYPALALMSCSLNGVKLSRAQAGKAKAAGMLKGEHDVRLPVARGQYIGLTIELKYGDNKPTEEQLWYGQEMAKEGHCIRYCWDWEAAKEEIEVYLALPMRT